jgi:hypothetical protein
VGRQEGLLKLRPGSPRRLSRVRGSAAGARASRRGRVGRRGPMKREERASWREGGSEMGSRTVRGAYAAALEMAMAVS